MGFKNDAVIAEAIDQPGYSFPEQVMVICQHDPDFWGKLCHPDKFNRLIFQIDGDHGSFGRNTADIQRGINEFSPAMNIL